MRYYFATVRSPNAALGFRQFLSRVYRAHRLAQTLFCQLIFDTTKIEPLYLKQNYNTFNGRVFSSLPIHLKFTFYYTRPSRYFTALRLTLIKFEIGSHSVGDYRNRRIFTFVTSPKCVKNATNLSKFRVIFAVFFVVILRTIRSVLAFLVTLQQSHFLDR